MRGQRKTEQVPFVKVQGDIAILPKLAFRVDELVHVLGLGKTKIRELIDHGELGHIREGSAVLVTSQQLNTYIVRKQIAAGWSDR